MPDSKLVPSGYKKLIAGIVCRYEGVRRSLVVAGWNTGRDIVLVEQKGERRAARNERLLQKLSADLTTRLGSGFSVQSLRRMRQFYLDNPKRSPASVITWAHHIELLPIRDKTKRLELEKRAEQEELDRNSLRVLVRHEMVREEVAENLARRTPGVAGIPTPGVERVEPPDLLPVPKLGLLNTYQIRAAEDVGWPEKGVLLLDRGFRSYCPLTPTESKGLKAGDIVGPNTNSIEAERRLGPSKLPLWKKIKSLDEWTGTKLRKIMIESRGASPKSLLYTYRAYLQKVIDGDTLWVVLDTGVRNVMREKLRLRGIDCPEVDTVEGKAAKKFVENLLRDVPSLTILSSQNATYDRFEADVWFIDAKGKQVYLNNEILKAGLAVRIGE